MNHIKCVSSSPPPTPPPPPIKNLATRSILGNEKRWESFRQLFNWGTSQRTVAYFKLSANDAKPDYPMGVVNATDSSVCTRLCMRIEGCNSFAMNESTEDYVTCHVYQSTDGALISDSGSKYYTIANSA